MIPSIAKFAMNQTAKDFAASDRKTAELVNRSFYMDDFDHFFECIEIDQAYFLKVKTVLIKGGFNLTKFVSNKPEVSATLPEADVARTISTQRLLGVHWDTDDETIFVKTQIIHNFQVKNMTLRRTLSSIMTKFDPLRFLAPFVITMQTMLQVIWRYGISLDEQIALEHNTLTTQTYICMFLPTHRKTPWQLVFTFELLQFLKSTSIFLLMDQSFSTEAGEHP